MMDRLAQLMDRLIPGGGSWPAASAALPSPAAVTDALGPDDRAWLEASAEALATASPDAQANALRQMEREQPGPFGRVLDALYEAYYSTPGAQAQVRRQAEAGPREASPTFDERMLGRVLATGAGRRRL